MYTAFLTRTWQSIDALKRHLATSEALRSVIHEKSPFCKGDTPCVNPSLLSIETAPDRLEWRIIDHCAAVTRIYAIYEQFAHEMIREHLGLLQKHITFSNLPTELKNSYRKGIATVLEKKEGPRYGHIDLSNLIEQYGLALSDKPYILEPLAILIHEQNLRLPELTRIFAACGVPNISAWITKHRSIKEFFENGERLASSAEHEMIELIKYRNDAAHGSINIDDVLGLDYLYEFCDFISAVCEAISESVQLAGLKHLMDSGFAESRGKVKECLKSGGVLIGVMTGSFHVGTTVYLCADDYCMVREVRSIQVNGINHPEVSLLEPTELGLGIDKPGREKAEVIAINYLCPETFKIPSMDNGELSAAPAILGQNYAESH